MTETAQKAEPLTMKLWPDAGKALGLSRNGTYEAAKRGEIPVLPFKHRKIVSTAAFRRLLESVAVKAKA